eukprot:752-Heterococcus_DN1.PRE.1
MSFIEAACKGTQAVCIYPTHNVNQYPHLLVLHHSPEAERPFQCNGLCRVTNTSPCDPGPETVVVTVSDSGQSPPCLLKQRSVV